MVDDAVAHAQALVVLGGGTPERQNRAIELYKQGLAPLIISTGDGERETSHYIYLINKIPRHAVVIESKSRSTWENARYTVPILKQHGITNAILVTSWFHSRRALQTFRHASPATSFYSTPTYWGARRDLWKPCGLRRYILLEFIKTPYYWVRCIIGA
ncbi:YdcF family protein [Fontisphaera persica]|uniref:YdcF family protein n=1 Tax=Fontisphaera persica TaxID=2974023 RepID=UPI003CCDF80B